MIIWANPIQYLSLYIYMSYFLNFSRAAFPFTPEIFGLEFLFSGIVLRGPQPKKHLRSTSPSPTPSLCSCPRIFSRASASVLLQPSGSTFVRLWVWGLPHTQHRRKYRAVMSGSKLQVFAYILKGPLLRLCHILQRKYKRNSLLLQTFVLLL